MSEWHERAPDLAACINEGLNADEAARALSDKFKTPITRNACLGAAHRRGWAFGRPVSEDAIRSAAEERDSIEPLENFPVECMAAITSVSDLALATLQEYRIVQKALAPMLERVNADPDMMAQIMARLVEGECRRLLETAISEKHAAEKRRTGGGPLGAQRSSDMTAWANAVESALLDGFKLPNGKKLGDATRSDISAALASYEIQASDFAVKHRWMRLIQQSVPDGKRVRDVLTEERVAELRAEAKKVDA